MTTGALERDFFENTFEYAAVGIAHLATDGRWIRVNRKLCEITGYTRDELLALSFQGVTHPDDLARDLLVLRTLGTSAITTYSTEKRYIRKDGQCVWVSLEIAFMCNALGAPGYGISIIQDISEKKHAAALIERMAYVDQLTGLGPTGPCWRIACTTPWRRRHGAEVCWPWCFLIWMVSRGSTISTAMWLAMPCCGRCPVA